MNAFQDICRDASFQEVSWIQEVLLKIPLGDFVLYKTIGSAFSKHTFENLDLCDCILVSGKFYNNEKLRFLKL